jgi:hypothetical protein
MKEKKLLHAILIFVFSVFLSAGSSSINAQPGECKINFCNCCGDSVLYYAYDNKTGVVVGTFWTWSDGCTHGSVGINFTPWGTYRVVPQGCSEGPNITYFTACVCPPYKEWADTVRLLCCTGDDGGLDKHGHNINIAPDEYSLFQNFPNPFNPATTIKFALPVESFVTLIVYDAAGKEVASLAGGIYPAGSHQVSWDATNFASGIYFYKLKAGEYSAERKMALIK